MQTTALTLVCGAVSFTTGLPKNELSCPKWRIWCCVTVLLW
jgi:hypothetical protein